MKIFRKKFKYFLILLALSSVQRKSNLRMNAAYKHPCMATIVDLVLGFEHTKDELYSETTPPTPTGLWKPHAESPECPLEWHCWHIVSRFSPVRAGPVYLTLLSPTAFLHRLPTLYLCCGKEMKFQSFDGTCSWNGWSPNLYLADWLLVWERRDKCVSCINWRMMDSTIIP